MCSVCLSSALSSPNLLIFHRHISPPPGIVSGPTSGALQDFANWFDASNAISSCVSFGPFRVSQVCLVTVARRGETFVAVFPYVWLCVLA